MTDGKRPPSTADVAHYEQPPRDPYGDNTWEPAYVPPRPNDAQTSTPAPREARYEYQYVEVIPEALFGRHALAEHREVIDREALAGWRFVAQIPTDILSGKTYRSDLVFEREVD